jgi:hypothetical protein
MLSEGAAIDYMVSLVAELTRKIVPYGNLKSHTYMPDERVCYIVKQFHAQLCPFWFPLKIYL